jgi:hypothetical protein
LSTAAIVGALGAYHGVILRRDHRLGVAQPRRVSVIALVAPGAEELLAEVRQGSGHHFEVAGYLAAGTPAPTLDIETLQGQLAMLGTQHDCDSALLILHADGGTVYPYSKRPAS